MYHVFINNRKYMWCLLNLFTVLKISLFLAAQILNIFQDSVFLFVFVLFFLVEVLEGEFCV